MFSHQASLNIHLPTPVQTPGAQWAQNMALHLLYVPDSSHQALSYLRALALAAPAAWNIPHTLLVESLLSSGILLKPSPQKVLS